jgi:hypothetical protein
MSRHLGCDGGAQGEAQNKAGSQLIESSDSPHTTTVPFASLQAQAPIPASSSEGRAELNVADTKENMVQGTVQKQSVRKAIPVKRNAQTQR